MKRPTSVTVVAWLIIVVTAVGAIPMLIAVFDEPTRNRLLAFMGRSAIPVPIQLVAGYGGLVLSIVCGAFLLRGANWARILFITWCCIGTIMAYINLSSVQPVMVGMLEVAVVAYFLTRPAANEFFATTRT